MTRARAQGTPPKMMRRLAKTCAPDDGSLPASLVHFGYSNGDNERIGLSSLPLRYEPPVPGRHCVLPDERLA